MSQHHSCFSVAAYGHAALFLTGYEFQLLYCPVSIASFCTSRYKQCFFNTSWECCAFNRSAVGIHKIKAARCCTGTRSPLCCCLCLCQSPENPRWSCSFPCGVKIMATTVGAEGLGTWKPQLLLWLGTGTLSFRLGRQLYYNVPYLLKYFAKPPRSWCVLKSEFET